MSAWCGMVISAAVLTSLTTPQAMQCEGKSFGSIEESTTNSSLPLEVYPRSHPKTEKDYESKSVEENQVIFEPKQKTELENMENAQKTKAYTITANDFLEITADKLKENNISRTLPTNGSSDFEQKTEESDRKDNNVIGPDLYTITHDVENRDENNNIKSLTIHPSTEHTMNTNYTIAKTVDEFANKPEEKPPIINITSSNSPDNLSGVENITENAAMNTSENYFSPKKIEKTNDNKTYFAISNEIADAIKTYSNDVFMTWEKEKADIQENSEANSVLKDYMDKILISQAANNTVCVKKDLENHTARTKTLQEIVKSCGESLERKEWNELQDKTKEILNEIQKIEQNVSSKINELPKDQGYEENKAAIENSATRKLIELSSPIVRESFEKLKNESLHNDEEEYSKCINDKTQKGIIMDTMTDIMRIKNNCVG